MVNIIPVPEWQVIDQNGEPIVGASVYTYVPGTLTLKATYQDYGMVSQNTNPVVTDAAGRTAPLWGTGDFRIILKDASGSLLFDQVTRTGLPESAVSAAMLPVLGATTLSQARTLMGIDDEIQSVITSAITSAIATEAAARAAGDAAEAATRFAQDTALQNQRNTDVTNLNAEDAHLQSEIDTINGTLGGLGGTVGGALTLQTGTGTSDADGNVIINYSAFPHALWQFTMTTDDPAAEPFDSISFFNPNWWNPGLGIFTTAVQSNGQAQGSFCYNDPMSGLTTTLPNTMFTWTAIGY